MLQLINTWLVFLVGGARFTIAGLVVVALAELLRRLVWLFIGAIIIQVILSWVAQGVYNPIIGVIDSLCAPLMRPLRRRLPPLGGLDLSPLVVLIGLQLVLMLVVTPLRDAGYMLL